MAPVEMAWSSGITLVVTAVLRRICSLTRRSISVDFGRIERGVVGEVETQARRFDHAAGLLDVRSEHLAQRGMEQVRSGVVALGGRAFGCGDFGAQFIARRDGRVGVDLVHGQAGDRGIAYLDRRDLLAGRRVDRARRDRRPVRRFRRRTASGREPFRLRVAPAELSTIC